MGDLPPSSSVQRVMLAAASAATCLPPRTLPVNDTCRMRRSATSCRPVIRPGAGHEVEHAGGAPGGLEVPTRCMASKGVISDAFSTTVHPAASAAESFRMIW